MNFGNALSGDEALRGEERGMSSEFGQHQLRDPGVHLERPHIGGGMRPPRIGGLGGVHMRTMPHLRRFGAPHFQSGGLSDPQAAGPPDPGADPSELQSPDDEMSPQEQQEKQIVLNAMAALDGQSPDPEADIKAFIQQFGARALADLQQLVEQHHMEQSDNDMGGEGGEGGEDQPGEPGEDQNQEQEAADALRQAGGGLLHGRGTGQSDEIEASTPSGHPVLLSDGEYVIDAPTVAALGDGSTSAGARRLDDLRKQIRSKAHGHAKQGKPMSKGGQTVVLRLK